MRCFHRGMTVRQEPRAGKSIPPTHKVQHKNPPFFPSKRKHWRENAATGIRTQATGATSRGHAPRLWRRIAASIGTRTRILTLEGLNTTLVLWTQDFGTRVANVCRASLSVFVSGPIRRYLGHASIAQLAEHVPRKHKVASSILAGGYMA